MVFFQRKICSRLVKLNSPASTKSIDKTLGHHFLSKLPVNNIMRSLKDKNLIPLKNLSFPDATQDYSDSMSIWPMRMLNKMRNGKLSISTTINPNLLDCHVGYKRFEP